MKFTKFEKPCAVEDLLFEVKPELVDKFIQLDHEIWTLQLSKYPGFVSKEVWASEKNPGQIQTVIYWSDMKLWKAIDHNDLVETDKKFAEAMGAENYKMTPLCNTNVYYKVSEYK